MSCPFCEIDRDIVAENEHSFSILDAFSVSLGHALVIPKQHVSTIFDLKDIEYSACFDLVRVVKDILQNEYSTDAFNIGVNCNELAGQTIFHAHIHVIPRYAGDVEDPTGGVRNVIPGRGAY